MALCGKGEEKKKRSAVARRVDASTERLVLNRYLYLEVGRGRYGRGT